MKSGLIVYVVGNEPPNWDAKIESKAIQKNNRVDSIEIITAQSGHFDVLDAWWSLVTKGMQRITCRIGEFSAGGQLMLTPRELHLCG